MVASYPQVMQQLLQGNSEKARYSQVTVIHSHGLKQVMTLLVLLSFATSTQLLRKEGITDYKLDSSKRWDTTAMVTLNGHSEFINPEIFWKIDVWKTGGLLCFSPASTSSDMTQPADNIKLITTRHMSKTVTHDNGVVYIAADMQTQSNASGDKEYPVASQHNTIVIKDAINEEKKSSAFGASKQFCRLRSRDVVKYNGHREQLLPSQHSGICEGAVRVYCFLDPSSCDYGNQDTVQFPEGIITNYEAMEIISPDNMECGHLVNQHSGGNGTVQKSVNANQETEPCVHWHMDSNVDFMTDRRMNVEEVIQEQRKLLLKLKKSVSTLISVDQCGWAENIMCKINQTSTDFLLHLFKHYSDKVMTVNENSIGNQSCSRKQSIYYMILIPHWNTKPNSNIALKAEIIQKMLSIENNLRNDEVNDDMIMRVADSAQVCFNEEHVLNGLRSLPSNFMFKADTLMNRDHNSIIISINRLETLGTGLDNNKTTLCSSKSVQHGPSGSMIKQDKLIQENMVGQSSAKYSMMAIDRSAVTSICTKEPWEDKGQQSPPPAAAATAWTTRYMSLFSTPEYVVPPTLPTTIQCSPSPCAPQVENYALDAISIPRNLEQETLMPEKQAWPAPQVERPRTRSIARVKRLVIPSPLEISEEEHGQDRTSYFVPTPFGASKSCGSSKPPLSSTIIASPRKGRGFNNHPWKTIATRFASPRKGRASNDCYTSAQRRGRMSQYMPLIAGASLHHGLPSLCKENDGERCSNNMIRRKTPTSAGGRRA